MKLLILFISSFLLVSCVSVPLSRPLESIESKEIWERFWENQNRKREVTREIQGKIDLDITDKENSLSGTGGFYSGTSGLRLELRDALGRIQYTTILKGKNLFVAYYPSQKVAYFDRVQGKAYLEKFLGLGLTFYELKDLWLGVLPFSKDQASYSQMLATENKKQVEVSLTAKDRTMRLSIDPITGEIYRIQWDSLDFKAVFDFSDFSKCCESVLAQTELPLVGRSVLLKIGEEKSEIQVDWGEIKASLKKEDDTFRLQLPESTKKVLLR